MTEEIVFCKGGGCTAKLGPDLLSHVLDKIPRGEKDPDRLIGYDSRMMRLFIRSRKIPPLSRRWTFFRRCWKIRICLARLQRQML